MQQDEELSRLRPIRGGYEHPTKAVILAAGRGRRLLPQTKSLPKPLLKIGEHTLLEMTLSALKRAGVSRVCIVINYLGRRIIRHIAEKGSDELTIDFVEQRKILGTADALLAAAKFIDQPAFVLAADYALPDDYLLKLKRAYQASEADIFLSLRYIAAQEISQRSTVEFGDSGQILKIIEKPEGRATSSVILGASLIYIVPSQITGFLPSVPLSPRGEYELPSAINMMIAGGYLAKGLIQPPPGEWQNNR